MSALTEWCGGEGMGAAPAGYVVRGANMIIAMPEAIQELI
jgi:hypothetical protein